MAAATGRPPLIGVTTSEMRRAGAHRPAARGRAAAARDGARHAVRARARARGRRCRSCCRRSTPTPSPRCSAPLAGVCLSGGPDLDPAAYGARAAPAARPDRARPRRVRARGRPPRGRAPGCRSSASAAAAQALNVARGGTLLQHLPDVTDGPIDHRQTDAGLGDDARRSGSRPGSRLARVAGRRRRST